MVNLFKSTVAYKILSGDKKKGFLSHAYLLLCDDDKALLTYLKVMAKTIACQSLENGYCDKCRYCRLIEKNAHFDVTFYPKGDAKKILTADIDDLISQTYVKPMEGEKRIFVLNNAESMNASAQNKLLKTLEEPPKGVHIILGATNENALLATIKSRVKKIEVPSFSEDQLFNAFKNEYEDEKRLQTAIDLCDGKAGYVKEYYEQDGGGCTALVHEVLTKMATSREMPVYSNKITKDNIRDFLLTLKKVMTQIIKVHSLGGKSEAEKQLTEIYPVASAIGIIEKINKAQYALHFNGNVNMIADGILFSVLEEKIKWKKL